MINGLRVIAIIPARGGSKGLPNKNIKSLHGKPLIAWTIEKALATPEIDNVVVSTDYQNIADISRQYGAEVPFLRPPQLSSDTATSFSVVEHCINYYKNELSREFDIVVLLEPTSPLREDGDLSGMLKQFSANFELCNAVISLGEVSEHPNIVKKVSEAGYIEPLLKNEPLTTRRQDNEAVYFPYGVAYMVKKEVLMQTQSFYPEQALPFFIKRYQCYEIDDIYDFLAIENIMQYEWKL